MYLKCINNLYANNKLEIIYKGIYKYLPDIIINHIELNLKEIIINKICYLFIKFTSLETTCHIHKYIKKKNYESLHLKILLNNCK